MILGAGALTLAGCHYYEILDPRTGDAYYSDRWVAADGYRGPLTFQDRSGRTIRLPQTIVTRMSREDFVEATRELANNAPESEPSPEPR
jgi:hypothetical protein